MGPGPMGSIYAYLCINIHDLCIYITANIYSNFVDLSSNLSIMEERMLADISTNIHDLSSKINANIKSKYVYIYSDFRIFISFYKSNPELYIKKFLRLFTDRGITCIVPSFSYTVSGSFDVHKTKSGVGLLGNFIMKKIKFERSEHPLFSFIAIGKNRKIVRNIGISAFTTILFIIVILHYIHVV